MAGAVRVLSTLALKGAVANLAARFEAERDRIMENYLVDAPTS